MATAVSHFICPPTAPEICYASPAFETSSGKTTRYKRSGGSSTDKEPVLASDGFAENDLRAGGPNLPEGPWETIFLPKDHRHYNTLTSRLKSEIRAIARFQAIQDIFFCGRRSRLEDDQQPTWTILIYALRRVPPGKPWIKIARRIYRWAQTKDLNEMAVEIVDPYFRQLLTLYTCLWTDPIVAIWSEVTRRILVEVDLAGIFSIGAYRVGTGGDRGGCPVTVVLGVDHKRRRDWKQAREQVLHLLESLGQSMVGVLIRKDKSPFDVRRGYPSVPCTQEVCTDAHMGYSIGPRLSKGVLGTLGGWFEIRSPETGEWLPLAVTCSHCILPSDSDLSGPDPRSTFGVLYELGSADILLVMRAWKGHGVPRFDADAEKMLLVDSPCYRDIQDGIDYLTDRIKWIEQDPVYQRWEQCKAKGEFIAPENERIWSTHADFIKGFDHDCQVTKDFFHKGRHALGHVVACSGLKKTPLSAATTKDPNGLCSILDWALIRPGNRIPDVNQVPKMAQINIPHLTGFREHGLEFNEQLFRVGRSTGLVSGICNHLKTVHIVTRIVNGKELITTTWEHTFVPEPWLYPVVEAGESGSLVFDNLGKVVGLCFGGTFSGDAGYFTHIDDLFESMKETMGTQDIRIKGGDSPLQST